LTQKTRKGKGRKDAVRGRQKEREQHYLDKSKGIQISYTVELDKQGGVVNYSLAYIDPTAFTGDNARVLGYDNQHGYHHRHYFGEVTAFEYACYDELVELFEKEFWELYYEYHD